MESEKTSVLKHRSKSFYSVRTLEKAGFIPAFIFYHRKEPLLLHLNFFPQYRNHITRT